MKNFRVIVNVSGTDYEMVVCEYHQQCLLENTFVEETDDDCCVCEEEKSCGEKTYEDLDGFDPWEACIRSCGYEI